MPNLLRTILSCGLVFAPLVLVSAGCQSNSHTENGALLGGVGGAGLGALVGHATGHTGAGAAIGAGVGALTGAAIGNGMDETEARNRALIEQKLQRRVADGAVSIEEVVAMRNAGVGEEVIINHVRYHGMVRELTSQDLISLNQQGVSPAIIKTMQEPPVRPAQQTVVVRESPPPVVVAPDYYDPYWHPYPYRYYAPPPAVGLRFNFR
jgi:outer membrane lipoprotein SlyB